MNSPVLATSTAKRTWHGTHRARPADETVAVARAVAPRLGITRVANVTGLDHIGIPTVMVCRPNARSLSVSQGKGIDLPSAIASGLMESIETWHAERPLCDLRLGAVSELRASHPLVDMEALPLRSDGRFSQDLRLLWARASSLTTGADVWAPYELVHLDTTLPLPAGSGCFVMSSNGLASGNHVSEALLHGLTELIERDALALFRHRPESARRDRLLDLATVDDETAQDLLDLLFRAGLTVQVWDITTDVGLAAVMAEIVPGPEEHHRRLFSARGYGCHTDPAVALARALTEAAQSRLTKIAGSRDDNLFDVFESGRDARSLERERSRSQVPASRPFRALPGVSTATFEGDLDAVLTCLKAVGLGDSLWFDLTREEVGIPVVKVLVPGLEGTSAHPAYRPGARALAAVGAENV